MLLKFNAIFSDKNDGLAAIHVFKFFSRFYKDIYVQEIVVCVHSTMYSEVYF